MLRYAELDHTVTAFEVSGNGPPLLLMHGAEADHRSFAAVADALSQHAMVINYDQRDCGGTKKRLAGDSSLFDVARDAAELVDFLGYETVSVLGTSLGGRVAQTFAIAYPQRVSNLMLCNTWPINANLAELNPRIRDLQRLASGLPETATALAKMYFSGEFVDTNPQVIDDLFGGPIFPGRAARRALVAEVQAAQISSITARTLLISGEEDCIVPTCVMRDMQLAIPKSEFTTIPKVGHAPSIETPDVIAAIVANWLATGT
jgi:pimeloyl-ACP methyl ester carboxylesterase